MPKRKSYPTICPWLSAKKDDREKRFIQVGNTLLLDKRFQQLGVGARMLYLCMAMESGGNRHYVFPRQAAEKYGISSTSLRRYVKELADHGFVEVRSGKNLREPNAYCFCLAWKLRNEGPGMAIYSRTGPDWYKEAQ